MSDDLPAAIRLRVAMAGSDCRDQKLDGLDNHFADRLANSRQLGPDRTGGQLVVKADHGQGVRYWKSQPMSHRHGSCRHVVAAFKDRRRSGLMLQKRPSRVDAGTEGAFGLRNRNAAGVETGIAECRAEPAPALLARAPARRAPDEADSAMTQGE